MSLIEALRSTELAEVPKKRVLVIGSNWEDRRMDVTTQLIDFFKEKEMSVEVENVRNAPHIENAILGNFPDGKEEKAVAVLVGQHARQYDAITNIGMTLEVEGSGLIEHIREICQKHGIFLGRFRRNIDSSFDFWEDGKSPEESKLLNP